MRKNVKKKGEKNCRTEKRSPDRKCRKEKRGMESIKKREEGNDKENRKYHICVNSI